MPNPDYNYVCRCLNIEQHALAQSVMELDPSRFFAAAATYVSSEQAAQMQKIIQAVETVIHLPVYQQAALTLSPLIAHYQPANLGVCMGYDFHLSSSGPQLIEINTNAAGALINGLLANAYKPCCITPKISFDWPTFSQQVLAMFQQEWHLQRGRQSLTSIAIVDENPLQQFMYPEFKLFKQLFEQQGIQTIIVSPQQLRLAKDKIWHNDLAIDLIYNRLTDFYFNEPSHALLAEAYLSDKVVVTPHPQAHALYANKRNLALLTDELQLRAWQVNEAVIQTLLQGIPKTQLVKADQAEQLWQQRKRLFFKPLAGYGSKGTYRGDRITHKVFNEIIKHDYIAQAFAPPSERYLDIAGVTEIFKVDLRNYVYQGKVQLLTARLYQGQTTNFRTEGGGFSPVAVIA